MEVGHLLVCHAQRKNQIFAERPADQLESDGESFRESAGERQSRQTG